MLNRISEVFAIIFAAITVTLASVFLSKDNNLNLGLDGSNFVESEESKEFNNHDEKKYKNPFENSFLADGFTNYSLYKYTEGNFKIEDSKFNGNIESYDMVTNDAIKTKLGRNDFEVVQLVIKTKSVFSASTKIKIDINKNDNDDLSIDSGYLRYVGGSNNSANTEGGFNPGTTKPLLVPDAITNDGETSMTANNVYIYRIRIDRLSDASLGFSKNPININVNVVQEDSNGDDRVLFTDKKAIYVSRIDKELPIRDDDKNSTFNIFSNPNQLAGFYNKLYYDKFKKGPIEDDKKFLENNEIDLNSATQYIDGNGNKYGEKEFSTHLQKYGEGSLFVADILRQDEKNGKKGALDDGDPNPETVKYIKSGIGDNIAKDNSWFFFKLKDNQLIANGNDGAPFDDYVFKMRSLGYRNLLLGDIMYGSGWTSKGFYSGNNKTQKWELIKKSLLKDDMSRKLVDAGLKHIDDLTTGNVPVDYGYNWIKNDPIKDSSQKGKLNAFFYFDEANVFNANKIFKSINEGKKSSPQYEQYLKTYFAIHIQQQTKDYKGIPIIRDVDILYLDNQSFFNFDNKKISELINYRNTNNKITGQYQLDSHSEYDLLRADPGSLVYELLILNKMNEPNYMKYQMNSGSSIDNYYTPNYFNYADGDASGEYCSIDSIDKLMTGEFNLPSNQSVRLEQLAYGVKTVKKINELGLKEKISSYVVPQYVGSRNPSKYMFDFKNTFEISTGSDSIGVSYVSAYLRMMKSQSGEIDALRVINRMI